MSEMKFTTRGGIDAELVSDLRTKTRRTCFAVVLGIVAGLLILAGEVSTLVGTAFVGAALVELVRLVVYDGTRFLWTVARTAW